MKSVSFNNLIRCPFYDCGIEEHTKLCGYNYYMNAAETKRLAHIPMRDG